MCSIGQWEAANCAAPSTANADQYATSIVNRCCLGFPESGDIHVGTFDR